MREGGQRVGGEQLRLVVGRLLEGAAEDGRRARRARRGARGLDLAQEGEGAEEGRAQRRIVDGGEEADDRLGHARLGHERGGGRAAAEAGRGGGGLGRQVGHAAAELQRDGVRRAAQQQRLGLAALRLERERGERVRQEVQRLQVRREALPRGGLLGE